MCSIIGYSGKASAAPIMVKSLEKMEYRGYDSVGLATGFKGNIHTRKGVGRVYQVNSNAKLDTMVGNAGIGHTRWATHGMVTDVNAHPHPSNSGEIAIVHNGVVENFEELKNMLKSDGYVFKSDTDSEVIANMLQKNYESSKDVVKAVVMTVQKIKGHYSFVAMFADGTLVAAKFHMSLIIGIGTDELFISSDVLGFIEYTDDAIYMNNGSFVVIRGGDAISDNNSNGNSISSNANSSSNNNNSNDNNNNNSNGSSNNNNNSNGSSNNNSSNGSSSSNNNNSNGNSISSNIIGSIPAIYGFDGTPLKYSITKVSKEFGDVYKGDYAHFTLMEICEQEKTIQKSGTTVSAEIDVAAKLIKDANGVYVTGSGTSYNAALIAKQILSRRAKTKAESIVSSEFGFVAEGIEKGSVLIAISQSGESADVLDAVSIAKRAGCQIISIVNLPMSSLAHESDVIIKMNCGPEIGVAATKSFTSQLAILYRIAHKIAGTVIDFSDIAKAVSTMLKEHSDIQKIAEEIKNVTDIYVLGRGGHYPIAKEAALKLKELTYIHAEGVLGGEMKHGTLAIMNTSIVAIVINPNDMTHEDTLIGTREIKARGAKIIGISDVKSDVYDYWIKIPATTNKESYPILEIIPIQLLAYYTALGRNPDPDHPKNLAKSVTVR